MATASDLQQLYIGYFGRAADQQGLNFWLDAINNGGLSLDNVHASFVQSTEYTAQYEGLTVEQTVAAVYENVLGRAADEAGLAFWTNAITTGAITEDQLIEGLLSGLSPMDALIVSNKVTVANYYTAAKGDAYSEASKAESGNILETVTASVQSVSDALEDVALVTGVTNAALSSALGALDAAQNAQQAFATAYLGDAANDDSSDIGAADTAITSALNIQANALNSAITAAGGTGDISPADTATVTTQKLQLAQTVAAEAVATAQAAVSAISGLTAKANVYTAAAATYQAAAAAQTAAQLEEDAELAAFDVISGGTNTVAGNGVVTGVIELDGTTLKIDAAYAASATAQQLAAANALLAEINARLAADKAADNADTALDTAAAAVVALSNDSYDVVANVLSGGKVSILLADQAQQKALADAIAPFNKAGTDAAQFGALQNNIDAADDAIGDLGYDLISVGDGDDEGTLNQELFAVEVVADTAADIGLTAGDALFIGAGYALGTDSNAALGIQGGNDGVLEVFLIQSAPNVVQIHIESSVFGTSAFTPETTVITLSGVTSVDQLSFDAQTGLITNTLV